ncbi:MAG: hypothetical protein ACYTGV_18735 [Planctomycetota bacterium]|jgi:hypothetical protein
MRVSILLLLVAVPVLAQEAPPLPPARLLKSDSLKEQAWGAYLAAEQKDAALIPALVRLAEIHGEDKEVQGRVVRDTALDSLIRLRAKVDWNRLKPLHRRNRNEVLILVAQYPRANRKALLELMEQKTHNAAWLTIRNLLVAQRAHGFAAALLRELQIHLHISVLDPDHRVGRGLRCGGIRGGCGDGVIRVQEGWPPVARYTLTRFTGRGAWLLAPGRLPVYVRRTEARSGRRGFGSVSFSIRKGRCRFEYLEELLGCEPPIQEDYRATVTWQSTRHFLTEAMRARYRVLKAFEETKRILVAEGLLAPEEAATLRPKLSVRVSDRREAKAPALPDLPSN